MIQDQTIDEALIEIMRTKKALEALRGFRRAIQEQGHRPENCHGFERLNAEAERAALDCRYKLADLRAGR